MVLKFVCTYLRILTWKDLRVDHYFIHLCGGKKERKKKSITQAVLSTRDATKNKSYPTHRNSLWSKRE